MGRWQSLFFSLPLKIHVWVLEIEGGLQGYMSATIDFATWSGRAFVYMDCHFPSPSISRKRFWKRIHENTPGVQRAAELRGNAVAHSVPQHIGDIILQ